MWCPALCFFLVSFLRWTYPLKSGRFELFCALQVSVLLNSSLNLPGRAGDGWEDVFLAFTAAANAHQVTIVAKEGPSDGTACFFPELFCTNRCPHRQEGRCPCRASVLQRETKKKKKKSGWTSKLFCNQTTSPLPLCWDVSRQYSVDFQTSMLIKKATKGYLAITETRLLSSPLYLDNFTVQ